METAGACPGKKSARDFAERRVESCRRDLLDHIIAVNDRHLKRLLSEYVHYYHDDRTHLGLGKGTPGGRLCCVLGMFSSQEVQVLYPT
jgi:hypothetical protein